MRILLLGLFFLSSSWLWADVREDLSSQTLLPEIVSSSQTPHAFDWRKASVSLNLSLLRVDEKNTFENDAYDYQFMGLLPVADSGILRMGLRRIEVLETKSSKLIGRTPFKQSASLTRYEVVVQGGYPLLEGRAISRLSFLPSLEQVFFVLAGAHYSHPNASWIPKKGDRPDPYPGQDQVHSNINLELGCLWQVYLPSRFGMFVDWTYQIPIRNAGDLKSWVYAGLGVSYVFEK